MTKPPRDQRPAEPAAETPQERSFEQSLEQLERIVSRLENGQLGLNESLKLYEEGIGHLRQCHRQLRQVERRIELLSGVDADGIVRAEPFAEEDMTLEQKRASRSRRRSRSPNPADSPSDSPAEEAGGGEDPQIDGRGSLF